METIYCEIYSVNDLQTEVNLGCFDKMPMCQVFTNIPSAKVTDDVLTKLHEVFTDAIKKDKKWCVFPKNNFVLLFRCVVHIVPDQKMVGHGRTTDPCALVNIMSIGNLGADENIRISGQIQGFLEEQLGIAKERNYIRFDDAPAKEVGWSGSTFGPILG